MKFLIKGGTQLDMYQQSKIIDDEFCLKLEKIKKDLQNDHNFDAIFYVEKFFLPQQKYAVSTKLINLIKTFDMVRGENTSLEITDFKANFIDEHINIKTPIFILENVGNELLTLLHQNKTINYVSILEQNSQQELFYLMKNDQYLRFVLIKSKIDIYELNHLKLSKFHEKQQDSVPFILFITSRININQKEELKLLKNFTQTYQNVFFSEISTSSQNIMPNDLNVLNLYYKNDLILCQTYEFQINIDSRVKITMIDAFYSQQQKIQKQDYQIKKQKKIIKLNEKDKENKIRTFYKMLNHRINKEQEEMLNNFENDLSQNEKYQFNFYD